MATQFVKFAACAALIAFSSPSLAQPSPGTLVVNPGTPLTREPLAFELAGAQWPLYLPASRFTQRGNLFEVDLEVVSDFFGPVRPDAGNQPIPVGQLPPGEYWITTRIHDLNKPAQAPHVQRSSFKVHASDYAGLFVVPVEPRTSGELDGLVASPFYIHTNSVKLTMMGNALQVSFDYVGDSWVMGSQQAPAGTSHYTLVRLPRLGAGSWRLEANGKAREGGGTLSYVPRDFEMSGATAVVEYYAASTDHYFMSAWDSEVRSLDSGAQPGWARTGQQFNAWMSQAQAPSSAVGVCRFYASGPNSHFYTANASECAYLKGLEARGEDEARQAGKSFAGWAYEGIAFWALPAVSGACPTGSDPVYRSYNERADEGDSNHRFTANVRMHAAMTFTWQDEGIAFCSPR